ncbi:MAG TPA: HAMP domain-containing protein [Candidatus Obscuribacterales bacterium]
MSGEPGAKPQDHRGLSLKTKITGVMLVTVSAIAAIVHFPWAYTSRQNVNEMVGQINSELMRGTENEVGNLFEDILASQQLIKSSLDDGLVELNEPTSQGRFYLNILQAHENFTWVQFAFANGDYLGVQRRPDGLYSLIMRQWDDTLGELGAPGTALAATQAERARRAATYKATQKWDDSYETARKTEEIYQFRPDGEWLKTGEILGSQVYYAPIRPFYEAAIAQPGESVWTDVYVYSTGNAVGLDAATTYQPVADEPIRGVISISFELRQISQYLASLKEKEQGAIFIVNPTGLLIASSNPDALAETFVGEAPAAAADLMPLAQVEDPLLQVAYQSLQANGIALDKLIGLQELSFYDPATRQRFYVALKPLGQLDWVVGTVTPESVFLERINRSKRQLLMGTALFLGTGAVAAISLSDRAITRPIMTISDAAEAIESGNFSLVDLDATVQRHDELGKLARVFQTMAKEVYAREQNLKQQLQALKIEIDESRKSREVREIVETDFFKDLKVKAQNLRERRQQDSAPPAKPHQPTDS